MLIKTINNKLENIETEKNTFSSKTIKHDYILVNVDESVLSSSTKINYSWNWKGIPSDRSAILFGGSVSVVSSIQSNGISIIGVRPGTIQYDTFIEYIEHLLHIRKSYGLDKNRISLFMDNSPVHWSKSVRTYLKKKRLTCIFLPQYELDLALLNCF